MSRECEKAAGAPRRLRAAWFDSRGPGLLRSRLAVLLLILVALVPAVPARVDGKSGPDKVAKQRDAEHPFAIKHPLPFKFGERLVYDVKFSRFPIHANVGELTFSVIEPAGSAQHVRFQVDAVSRGALVGLFGVRVNDVFTTLADRDDLFVYSTIKNLDEGEVRMRGESVFDRKARSVRVTNANLAAPSQAPSVTTAETQPWIQDIVSAFYFVRTRKLQKENREVTFYIADDGKTYDIGVAPIGREEVKTDVGTFKTIKVDARIFGGRFVRKEGQLFVWLTDDGRRIPVKAWLKLPAGTVTFDLTSLAEGTAEIVPAKRNLAVAGDE